LATNDTIFGIDKNQSVIDTTIAENRATSAVTTIDDIEFGIGLGGLDLILYGIAMI
jgi:hypothetical protein